MKVRVGDNSIARRPRVYIASPKGRRNSHAEVSTVRRLRYDFANRAAARNQARIVLRIDESRLRLTARGDTRVALR